MAISLSSIKKSVLGPPRVLLYGVQGIGKSTLASFCPKPVFIPVEDGIAGVDAFPQPTTYAEVLAAVEELIAGEHDYETLVLDGLDTMEPLLHKAVCEPKEKASIEDFGYGKGYEYACEEFRNLLAGFDALRARRGMSVVLIAHSTVVRVDPPDLESFDRYQTRLHKKADAVVRDWCDAVLFLNYEVSSVKFSKDDERRKGVGQGKRHLFCTERPSLSAKNRFGLPDKIEVDAKTKGHDTMTKLWATMRGASGAVVEASQAAG